jgi:diguanylate cyclase (GGDEF)-like protein
MAAMNTRAESRPSRHLPAQIAAVMGGTILVFALTLALAMVWMARRLDREAAEGSVRLVGAALESALDRSRSFAVDYALWDEAAQAAEAGDREWLWENMGSATVTGVSGNLVVIWGGGLAGDVGWIDQSPATGVSGLLGAGVLAQADRALAALPRGDEGGAAFYAWRGNDLFALGVARIERVRVPGVQAGPGGAPPARLALGRRLSRDAIAGIARATGAEGIALMRRMPEGRGGERLLTPLPGGDGAPIGWLAWDAPRPGSALLRQMAPLLLAVGTVAGALAALGLAIARRGARDLLAAEARARLAARTDPLTGLPNRAAFSEALDRPARAGERAVLYLDVNGFKRINDSFGHETGDAVLRGLAARLRPLCGEGDLLARVGGDEFVFLLSGPGAGERAAHLARRVEAALEPPFDLAGQRMRVAAAMGQAVQGPAGSAAGAGGDLVRRADLAMYDSKRRRAGAPALPAAIPARDACAIEAALRRAVGQGEGFALHYQPVLRLSDGALRRAEALARWRTDALGPVPPARFIPVAERAGLMGDLGRQLLRILADDLAAHPALRASVNLSARQIAAPGFARDLADLLGGRGIDPSRLEAEVTEAALAEALADDPRLAARRLDALREAGLTVALDDFGAGPASLATLRRLPLDTLKIDRALVAGSGAPEGAALLEAVIRLGRARATEVVCEGVETAEALGRVQALGADHAQGWEIARPMPVGRLAALWLPGGQAAVA